MQIKTRARYTDIKSTLPDVGISEFGEIGFEVERYSVGCPGEKSAVDNQDRQEDVGKNSRNVRHFSYRWIIQSDMS